MDEILDLHVYTNNSVCGHDKVSFLCETAVSKGIRALAFTDLCSIDAGGAADMQRRLRHSCFDMSKAKQLYFNAVSVFAGIEFEQAFADPAAVEAILARQSYDIVLSSVSRDRSGAPFFLKPDMPAADFRAFTDAYASLLTETVEKTEFDVLARLLHPLRRTNADFGYFEDAMHPVLRRLAEKGRALEVDTKDILGSERVRDLYLRLISFFREAGGTLITLGSESMYHDEIGSGIAIAGSAVKRAGFSQTAFYDKRLPYLMNL